MIDPVLYDFIIVIILVPRPEETEFNNATDNKVTVVRQEGSDQQEAKAYIKPLPTVLEITRTFPKPGTQYHLTLEAQNMHDSDDTASMTWVIECAHPVIPEDWDIEIVRNQHVTDHFNVSFVFNKADKFLPTMPIIRVIPITGDQRIDNDIVIDNSTAFLFAYKDNQGNLPNGFPDCAAGCSDFLRLEKMGINYGPADAVEKSDDDKKMGIYGEKFTIYVPIDIPAGMPLSLGNFIKTNVSES